MAILLHAELAVVFGLAAYFWAPRQGDLLSLSRPGEGESIDVSTIDEETSRKILAELEREEEKAKEEETKKEVEATESPGQVVELPKPAEEKRPDKARFASEFDSTVEKETKKVGRPDENARAGSQAGEGDVTRPASPASAPSKPSREQRGQLAMRPPGPEKSTPANPGAPGQPGSATDEEGDPNPAPPDPEGILVPGGRGAPVIPGLRPGGGAPSQPGSPGLVPSPQQIARAIGAGTDDHLEDIDEGEGTALNAKKWKFASFFNRVKQQVREHWKPGEEYRRRDPSGAIYGQKNRYTLLRVQLKPDGSLANVMLESSSDVEFLDDEAIQAFREAQPFPNPPKALVDGSGLINFRFGFYFELSGAPRMRIFRYNSM